MRSAFLRLAAAACLLLLPSGGASADRALRVCADPNNLPFSNAKEEGFENRIAEVLAQELGASLSYTWWPQRRGFLRNTLMAGTCDVVIGLPKGVEGVATTKPYYRSSYVFVTRGEAPSSFNDPFLREAALGVQLVGDDGWNTPPAHALARRGIVGNVRGYHLYADYTLPNPPARIIDAVASGEIDVAIAWGPLGGYFASREPVPLSVRPVAPAVDAPDLPMTFAIAMAVRKADTALRDELEAALARRRADIERILDAYGVPRVPLTPGGQP
jgi:mxaJ protein